MEHDWNKYFDTSLEEWDKLQKLYDDNDSYPKVIVSKRNLHHKFLRAFSRIEGKEIDNDKDNLVSLSEGDHFLAHYYIWKCTKKGYRRYTARPVMLMYRKSLKFLSSDTAENVAKDWTSPNKKFTNPKLAEFNHTRKGKKQSPEHIAKVRKALEKYNVPCINISSLKIKNTRKECGNHLTTDKLALLSNSNVDWENQWIKVESMNSLNRIFNTDFTKLSLEERKEMIKGVLFLRYYWKNDPEIIDRIVEELKRWY